MLPILFRRYSLPSESVKAGRGCDLPVSSTARKKAEMSNSGLCGIYKYIAEVPVIGYAKVAKRE